MQFMKYYKDILEREDLSNNSKTLFSLIADRISLSTCNGWTDVRGTFCYMTRSEMADKLKVCINSVTKYMKELRNVGLILEVKQGQGKANRIYLGFFDVQNHKKDESKITKNANLESQKMGANKTYIKHTETNQQQLKEDDLTKNESSKKQESAMTFTITSNEIEENNSLKDSPASKEIKVIEVKKESASKRSAEQEKEEVREIFTSEWYELMKREVKFTNFELCKLYELCKKYSTSSVLDVLRIQVNTNNWLRINIKPWYFVTKFEDIRAGEKYKQWD